MSMYCANTVTNFFRLRKDVAPETIYEIVQKVNEDGDCDIGVYSKPSRDGTTLYSFAGDGSILGFYDEEAEEPDITAFYNALADIVAEDDAIIIFESGHHKLCYVTGDATIITSKEIRLLSIQDVAIAEAGKMLGIDNYDTDCGF